MLHLFLFFEWVDMSKTCITCFESTSFFRKTCRFETCITQTHIHSIDYIFTSGVWDIFEVFISLPALAGLQYTTL